MQKKLLILMIGLSILIFCNQNRKEKSNKKEIVISQGIDSDFKTFDIDFGFKVTIGKEEDFETFKTYTYFELKRNNNIIYVDRSLIDYEFGNALFPIAIQTGDNSFELLFEINNRPSKNYLNRFIIRDDKLIEQDNLPVFEAESKDINNDGIKEYSGIWHYSQIWGENNNITAYSPILYYSVTETGLQLDSTLTRERNELIYGQFYGFLFSEKYEQPISIIDKFEQELNRIRSK